MGAALFMGSCDLFELSPSCTAGSCLIACYDPSTAAFSSRTPADTSHPYFSYPFLSEGCLNAGDQCAAVGDFFIEFSILNPQPGYRWEIVANNAGAGVPAYLAEPSSGDASVAGPYRVTARSLGTVGFEYSTGGQFTLWIQPPNNPRLNYCPIDMHVKIR